jgi:SPP1 gp7 family putative phage head morphogenesis protein
VENDALQLKDSLRVQQSALPVKRFDFPTTAAKADAFMKWLRDAMHREIVPMIGLPPAGLRDHWQSEYVRRGYLRGIAAASTRLSGAGASVPGESAFGPLAAPIHGQALELLYTRNLQELRGITAYMDQVISRELADGLSQGWNPVKIGRRINAKLDIGSKRAKLLARTEIIRAHAEGNLNQYEAAGISQVQGKAEFATAGDDRVCPDCEGLEGSVFPIAEARGLIPLHPGCRCTWLPVIEAGALEAAAEAA